MSSRCQSRCSFDGPGSKCRTDDGLNSSFFNRNSLITKCVRSFVPVPDTVYFS